MGLVANAYKVFYFFELLWLLTMLRVICLRSGIVVNCQFCIDQLIICPI
jgi:hypothetical protein